MHVTVDIGKKNVVIIGEPAAGKTYLSNLLIKDNPGHHLIHTDDYIKHGYVQALYKLLADIRLIVKPLIIEGVLGYRLLRKGAQTGCFYPDIVIEVDTPQTTRLKEYKQNRPDKDIHYLKSLEAANKKVLADYKAIFNMHKPQWVTLKNNY